jgi:hypothetical protein
VDAILISGKGARSRTIMEALKRRVGRIAAVRAASPDMIAYLAQSALTADGCLRPLGRY